MGVTEAGEEEEEEEERWKVEGGRGCVTGDGEECVLRVTLR